MKFVIAKNKEFRDSLEEIKSSIEEALEKAKENNVNTNDLMSIKLDFNEFILNIDKEV